MNVRLRRLNDRGYGSCQLLSPCGEDSFVLRLHYFLVRFAGRHLFKKFFCAQWAFWVIPHLFLFFGQDHNFELLLVSFASLVQLSHRFIDSFSQRVFLHKRCNIFLLPRINNHWLLSLVPLILPQRRWRDDWLLRLFLRLFLGVCTTLNCLF